MNTNVITTTHKNIIHIDSKNDKISLSLCPTMVIGSWPI